MNTLIPLVATIALLGSALIGGVFFAFSSFVMQALARVPSPEGMRVMQSINVVVINPTFLGAFMGTSVLSLAMIGLALLRWREPGSLLFLGGALCYLGGTFLVTVLGNVPLNNRLASASATDPAAGELWSHYRDRWTSWNHVRTGAAAAAASLYAAGLAAGGSA